MTTTMTSQQYRESKAVKPKNKTPEDDLHKDVAQFLALVLKPPTIWTTIGHGGGGRVRGAQLKAKGVKPGWPDILIVHPDFADKVVLGIELKAGKGRQSVDQVEVAKQFHRANCIYRVCRSLDEVSFELHQAGIL